MRIEEAEERARQALAALDLGVAFPAEPARRRKVRTKLAEAASGSLAAEEGLSARPIVRSGGGETERARQEEWLYRRHRSARTGWNRD